MIYREDKIDAAVKAYLSSTDVRWKLGNQVLYDLCREHPGHTDPDEIVAKIWLIGRSYAAAIERRKKAEDTDGNFYYDKVAPALISIGQELDKGLQKLNTYPNFDENALVLALDLHGFLVKTFYALTGMEKRSLASKYLHFHCPNMFFIYDSRANASIRKFVKKDRNLSKYISADCDKEYADFYVRILELRNYISSNYEHEMSPRELDDLLLYHSVE